jgi:hypothetical protein
MVSIRTDRWPVWVGVKDRVWLPGFSGPLGLGGRIRRRPPVWEVGFGGGGRWGWEGSAWGWSEGAPRRILTPAGPAAKLFNHREHEAHEARTCILSVPRSLRPIPFSGPRKSSRAAAAVPAACLPASCGPENVRSKQKQRTKQTKE